MSRTTWADLATDALIINIVSFQYIMKTLIRLFILAGCFAPTMAMTATALPAASPVVNMLTKDARPKVEFSFDHLADNPKVTRLYVSEEMLSVARAQLMKPDHWEFSHVVDRLTSILTMHTHSRSTTATIRGNYKTVSTMEDYELLLHQHVEKTDVIVFGVRKKGRALSELLIFRFRDDYCSRVVQMTGELTIDDIAKIIKLNKKM